MRGLGSGCGRPVPLCSWRRPRPLWPLPYRSVPLPCVVQDPARIATQPNIGAWFLDQQGTAVAGGAHGQA